MIGKNIYYIARVLFLLVVAISFFLSFSFFFAASPHPPHLSFRFRLLARISVARSFFLFSTVTRLSIVFNKLIIFRKTLVSLFFFYSLSYFYVLVRIRPQLVYFSACACRTLVRHACIVNACVL